MVQYTLFEDKNKLLIALQYKRRCGRCQENVRYVVRVRLLETMFLTLIDIQEESGTLTFRL